jgi:hypothetical protein
LALTPRGVFAQMPQLPGRGAFPGFAVSAEEIAMFHKFRNRWWLLVAAIVLLLCVLGLYGPLAAAPRESSEPFANAVEQRAEMIAELRTLNALVKEQNELLKSGRLAVTLVEPEDE